MSGCVVDYEAMCKIRRISIWLAPMFNFY